MKGRLFQAAVAGVIAGGCASAPAPVAPVVDVTPAPSATTKSALPAGTAKPPMRDSWEATQKDDDDDELVRGMTGGGGVRDKNCCSGKNDCKGRSGCRGAQNACSGQNACKGTGTACPKPKRP